jgi:hypothetical protein
VLNIFVLTYSGSRFTPEFLGDSDLVNKFQVVGNTFQMSQPVPMSIVFKFQAQVTVMEFFRLFARGFSMGQATRSASAALGLLSFPFSQKTRSQLERVLLKSQAVRHGHEALWDAALNSDYPCLLLEDDASLAVDQEELFGSLLEMTSRFEQPFGVELSRSYSFLELGIAKRQIVFLGAVKVPGDWYSVSPGASNTTCAAFYSQPTISALKSFSRESKFTLLPIDYFIDYFYLRNRDKVRNYHLIPGPFCQGSDFRQAP